MDRRVTWKTHIWSQLKQLDIQLNKMYWLIGRNSNFLVYKTVLKPMWLYWIPLWGDASLTNIAIIQIPKQNASQNCPPSRSQHPPVT